MIILQDQLRFPFFANGLVLSQEDHSRTQFRGDLEHGIQIPRETRRCAEWDYDPTVSAEAVWDSIGPEFGLGVTSLLGIESSCVH